MGWLHVVVRCTDAAHRHGAGQDLPRGERAVRHPRPRGELLRGSGAAGGLRVSVPAREDGYAYHDPCYLGRYNEVYEPPRQVLRHVEGDFTELPRCRDRGFCCGAGGARAFMEEKRGTRISHNRLEEALATGTRGVAVACPFCVTMFEDGIRALGAEERYAIRDVAEIVAEALDSSARDRP